MNEPGSSTPGPGGDQSTNYRSLAIKLLIESTPLLTADNYSMWRKKFKNLFKLRGVFVTMNDPDEAIRLDEEINQEFVAHLIAKLDSNTYNNVIDDSNKDDAKLIWISTQHHFASSQSANRARVFNGFLHLTMEANIDSFVTSVKVYLKKMTEVGIKLPSDIIAYLVLFKFPPAMQNMKSQIMHATTKMKIDLVLNHLIQHKNEVIAQEDCPKPVNVALYRGPRCENGKHNLAVTSHPASSCWFEFPELKPSNHHNQGKKSKQKQPDEAHFYLFFCGMNTTTKPLTDRFILDSGCSVHMITNRDLFNKIRLGDQLGKIQTGKRDAAISIQGTGEASIATKDSFITLSGAAWVPKSTVNLISLGALMIKGALLEINPSVSASTFKLHKEGRILLSGTVTNNLFAIDMLSQNQTSYYSSSELMKIHRSLGHASLGRMEKFLKYSIPTSNKGEFECLSCNKSKITQKPFSHHQSTASRCFEKIHLDLMGPINPTSKGGFKFILNLIDSYSGYLASFPLRMKSDFAETIIFILKNQHRKTNRYPKEVCSDGGGEFVNSKLQTYYQARQINQIVSKPYHSQHNGRVKRANKTIIEAARATISDSGLPKLCWHEVVKGCCLMLNQITKEKGEDSPWVKMHQKELTNN